MSPIIINISFAPNKSLVQWGGTTEKKNEVTFRILLKVKKGSETPRVLHCPVNLSQSISATS